MPARHRSLSRSARADVWLAVGVLVLAFSLLAPMLNSGFMGDDIINSLNVPAVYDDSAAAMVRATADSIASWVRQQGRFFPLAGLASPLFYYVNGNLAIYKTLMLMLVMADVALFGWLVRRLSGSGGMAALAVLLLPCLIQYRLFHDPVLAFSGLLPGVLLVTLGSLLLLTAYIRTGQRRYLVLSLLAYGASVLTYEVTVPFFVLHLAIARYYPNKHGANTTFRIAWPFAALAATAISGVVAMRLAVGVPLSGTTGPTSVPNYIPQLDIAAYLTTVAKQVVAAMPLSYHAYTVLASGAADPPPRLFGAISTYVSVYPVTTLAAMAALAVLTFISTRRLVREIESGETRIRTDVIAWLGILLLVVPALLIALSPRYQSEVYWGVGYLPVFISYFGVALLAIAGAAATLAALQKPAWRNGAIALLVITIALVGAMTYQDNRIVIERQNRDWLYPRQTEEEALQRGVLRDARDGDALLIDAGEWTYETREFFLVHGGLRLGRLEKLSSVTSATAPAGGALADLPGGGQELRYPAGARVFHILCAAPAASGGYVVAGRVSAVRLQEGRVTHVTLEDVRLYIRHEQVSSFEPARIGYRANTLPEVTPRALGLEPATTRETASGAGWSMYQVLATPVVIRPLW
jgi:hypothetical protein